ncbi:sensor histidine kinase [Actinoallomurus iriomotensis]|uniref:histidine kinase n=1 Tax=Actinoallomurus iriomotensis TaxID=478107 RepID=A0A9W6VMR5_9ACTN|nr:HAMP domain-containing sensor histidine kinase [Actinoallomurus iriomotensis]GLY72984.1 sensor protein CutS [Actinoallomurus iriomotensis]
MRLLLLIRRLPPRTVRLRLTLLYGALFAVSGAVLLAVTYLLVSNSTGRLVFLSFHRDPASDPGAQPLPLPDDLARARTGATRQHAAELHELLVQSGIALAITLVISIALGWLVAGRVLRPLQTMTTAIRQISARNVHERLAAGGPRDELKDLADTVDGLLGRLETALDAHKRFVANAAHELRTPLTLQHALLEETLTDRAATLSSFQATFERLLVNSEQQERLLESLLTLTRSERGLDRRRPLDLATIADHVLLAPRPEAALLRVGADTAPAPASGDRTLVERLVTNLVDNATHYNHADGWVEVTTATVAGRAVLSVANTGPVIPAEQVDRLFEPFQRLGDRTARNDGHHGLGLSIVRAIAAAHDATVTARARPEGGLIVEVAFPAGELAAVTAQ